jgi:hypothetical protein
MTSRSLSTGILFTTGAAVLLGSLGRRACRSKGR